jgi:hypothetical protein
MRPGSALPHEVRTDPVDASAGRRSSGARSRTLAIVCAAALGLCAPSVVALSAPSQAHAGDYPFNCGVLSVGSWCYFSERHTYYGSSAEYGTNYVCTKLLRNLDGTFLGQACGDGLAYLQINPVYLSNPLVYNGGPAPHTIYGHGYT